MADDANQRVEDALEKLVSIIEKSGNLRKDLRQDILESVSAIRKEFSMLKSQIKTEKNEQNKLREEVRNAKDEMARRDRLTTRQVAPSLDHTHEPTSSGDQLLLPPGGGRRKLYSEVTKQEENKRYKLTLTSRDESLTPEQIKIQLKRHINPTDIKVGIKAIKTIRDRGILIETGSEDEMHKLTSEINTRLGDRLEATKHRLRKPRMIIFNVPTESTIQNIAATIINQNPEIQTNGENIEAKYKFKDRKGRDNIVIEVGPKTRQQILQLKLKLGWEICNAADYLVPTRCYKCSRYNHRHNECKGEETCPLCTGSHKMKECTAETNEHKCINCITYNRYSKKEKIDENHSALNKKCPSLQAVLTKYRNNIDY